MNDILDKELNVPEGINDDGLKAWKVIVEFLAKHQLDYTGGCKAFYSGAEAGKYHGWDLTSAALVVHYDGGELRYCFNRAWETPNLVDKLNKTLDHAGFYVEELTCWAAAIYVK